MNKQNINSDLKNKLFATDENIVLSALDSLKERGNKNYLPLLFELLLSKPEKTIEKEILTILGTVKDKESIPIFMDAVKEEKFLPIRKEILVACWNNGLDYSPHLNSIVNLIINDEWVIAFEAFTIIENLEHFPQPEETKEIKLKIAGALKSIDEQKVYFLEELLRLIP
jgi:HEAT repeat protein